MTSLSSRTSLLFVAGILASFCLLNLSNVGIESAEAKIPQKNAVPNTPRAEQEQVDETGTQPAKLEIYQTDYSKNFSYILPQGWQITQNPMYPHDILVKHKSEGKGNIVLTDQQAKGNLGKMSTELLNELPKQCDDFKLVSNEMIKLPCGANCARLKHTGKLGESEICQVNYLMPYTRGRILVITGTVISDDKEGLDTVEKFAFSVTMKKKKLSL
jgi:hypothetical protein